MKKIISNRLGLLSIVILLITGSFIFGEGEDSKKSFKIGLAVLKDNPDYSAARTAFVNTLEKQKDIGIEFRLLDAYGDLVAYEVGLKRFAEVDKVDLIFTTGTRSTQPAVSLIKDIPIVFTAVAAPERVGIVKNLEKPGENVTGTHCGVPAETQVRAILKVLPSVKTLGIVYTKDEPNAEIQTEDFKKAASKYGLQVLTSTVSKETKTELEVSQATEELVGKVDILIAHQDTSLSRYGRGMIAVAEKNKIPTYVSLEQLLSEGAVFSLGIDFSSIGAMAGRQAILILKQESSVGEIPVGTDKQYSLSINLGAAKKINLVIPVKVLRLANKIIR